MHKIEIRKGRVNVIGGLRYHDKKRICYFIEKGESKTFYNKIRNLNESVKKEWLEQGNEESDFTDNGPRIIVILDNASFHKKKEIIDKIEAELPNIILEYLPEYSPDYNLDVADLVGRNGAISELFLRQGKRKNQY